MLQTNSYGRRHRKAYIVPMTGAQHGGRTMPACPHPWRFTRYNLTPSSLEGRKGSSSPVLIMASFTRRMGERIGEQARNLLPGQMYVLSTSIFTNPQRCMLGLT